MKYFFSLLLCVVIVSSCATEDTVSESKDTISFMTVLESIPETRTHLNESKLNRWDENDMVSVFAGKTLNQKFMFDGNTGDDSGSFSLVGNPTYFSGNKLPMNISVYPYQSTTSVSENGMISFDFPSVQLFAQDSFGLGANTMVAVTENTLDDLLLFKNVCGYLKISLFGDELIKSITLHGNDGENISGSGYILASHQDIPVVSMSSTARDTITIDCGEGIQLGSTVETATDFYFVIPPIEFEHGITIKVIGGTIYDDGIVFEKSTTNPISIIRNRIQKMSALKCEKDYDKWSKTIQSEILSIIDGIVIDSDVEGGILKWENNTPHPYDINIMYKDVLGETITEIIHTDKGEQGNISIGSFVDETQVIVKVSTIFELISLERTISVNPKKGLLPPLNYDSSLGLYDLGRPYRIAKIRFRSYRYGSESSIIKASLDGKVLFPVECSIDDTYALHSSMLIAVLNTPIVARYLNYNPYDICSDLDIPFNNCTDYYLGRIDEQVEYEYLRPMLPTDSWYNEGWFNHVNVTQSNPTCSSEWTFITTGGDPWLPMGNLESDALGPILSFRYKSSHRIMCEFFWCSGGFPNGLAGGRETPFLLEESSEWKQVYFDMSGAWKSFSYNGKTGDGMRLDIGDESGVTLVIDKMHWCPKLD